MTAKNPVRTRFALALIATTIIYTTAITSGLLDVLDSAVNDWTATTDGYGDSRVWSWITDSGGSAILVPVLAIIALWMSRRTRSWRPAILLACGYAITVGVYVVMKNAVGRARPTLEPRIALPQSAAFPSGHAAQAMACAILLTALLVPLVSRRNHRLIAGLAIGWAVLVGISRVYLGVHWTTDVVGGWLVGAAVAAIVLTVDTLARTPPPEEALEAERILIVSNPRSGSTRAGRTAIEHVHRSGATIVDSIVLGGDIATEMRTAIAAHPSATTIAVAGGDGTIGIAADVVSRTGQRIAILPAGTGNDTARFLGVPLDGKRAAELATASSTRHVDLGDSNHGRFLHALSIGIVADFADAVHTVSGWRRPISYPRHAIEAWRNRREITADVTVDDTPVELPPGTVQLAIINAPRLGGRVGVDLPGADIDDEHLYLVALSDRGLARWLTITALRSIAPQLRQSATNWSGAVTVTRGQRFSISSDVPLAISIDGEPVGHSPITAWVVPAACRVAVPQRMPTEPTNRHAGAQPAHRQ